MNADRKRAFGVALVSLADPSQVEIVKRMMHEASATEDESFFYGLGRRFGVRPLGKEEAFDAPPGEALLDRLCHHDHVLARLGVEFWDRQARGQWSPGGDWMLGAPRD